MLVVGAIQNFIGLERVLDAFWGKTGTTPADFLNLTNITSNYVESVTWVLQVVLGDGFLVSALFFFLRLASCSFVIEDLSMLDLVWETMVGNGTTCCFGCGDALYVLIDRVSLQTPSHLASQAWV